MFSIKHLLIEPKLLYFLMYLPFYVFYNFRPIYFEYELEIKNEKYGTIAAIISLTAIVSPIFWTSFADKFKRHKLILMLTTLGNCLFFLCFAPIQKDTNNKVLFAGFIIFLDTFFQYAMLPLLDARVMKILLNKFSDNARYYFGRQRLWGSLAYGFITLLVGKLDDSFSDKTFYYYLSVVTTAIFLAVAYFIIPWDEPKGQGGESKNIPEKQREEKSIGIKVANTPEESLLSKYGQLLTNPNYMFFLLVTFCNGFSRGVGTHYLASFTKSSINNRSVYVGLQTGIGVAVEVTLYFFNGRIVENFDIYWLLILSQLAMSVRMTFYAFVPTGNPDLIWAVLSVELLRGVSFAFMQITGVQIPTESAPQGLEASAMGLFSAVFSGVSPAVAAIVGGYCNRFHRQLIFQVSAATAWISLIGFFIKYYVLDSKLSRRKSK